MFVMSWGAQPLLANPTIAFFWFLGGMAGRRRYDVEAGPAGEPARVADHARTMHSRTIAGAH